MVYKSNYVVAIKLNGKVLREGYGYTLNDTHKGVVSAMGEEYNVVYLPYYSEYSILLKNNNSNRSLVHVEIDGMDTLGGSGIILDGHQSFDLERFLTDGNLSNGKKFKFVPLSDERVQDPSNEENGLVLVTFTEEIPETSWIILEQKEKQDPIDPFRRWPWPDYPPCPWPDPNPWGPYPRYYWDSGHTTYSANVKGSAPATFNCSNFVSGSIGDDVKMGNTKRGATVEGEVSNQRFKSASFGKHGKSFSFEIVLRAQEKPVLVEDTKNKYCTKCGKKIKYSSNFCSNCGQKF